jgi:plasmid stabilization system protein ParE
MKVLVRQKADLDLDSIAAWINQHNPTAASLVIRRIRQDIGRLSFPGMSEMGRLGRDASTRELVDGPYIVVYEINKAQKLIEILAIFHSAQDR